ncbi:MAG TPA: SulP family inorganic anion transporter [Silvibacterium sp.]|nr:SulP family inorganic anion transporter [Silvibacterium sp.]
MDDCSGTAPKRKPATRLSLFPSVRPLTAAGVIRDAAAGVQLAAVNIPQALGYTKIAGTPVVTGLYTLLIPLVAFAAFGSSRYLVVAADSATAAILAGGLSGMAPIGSPKYAELAATVALLTAFLLLVARLLKLGFLADFLSQTVLAGFLTGVGFQVGFGVLGQMLGVQTHARYTVMKLAEVIHGLPKMHLPTLEVSAAVLAIIVGLRRLAPKAPGALIAVVGAIAASARWNFAAHGISTIGPVQGGLPRLGLILPDWKTTEPLIGVALSCTVMIIAQSAATARIYAERHKQELDENMDLVGLSAANATAALSGAFPVNGSPTQTAMVEGAGGTSQMAQVSTAVVVALVLLFLTRPLEYLPQCALGAIVFLIAMRLINLRGLWLIRSESPGEFAVAVMTASVVVVWGVEQGIVLAMIASLLRIVSQSYHPNSGVMVMNDLKTWDVVPPVPGTVTQPGLVIYRFGAALFYANAHRFAQEVKALATPEVKWVVVDAEAITHVDYSAARIVRDVHRELASCGVVMAFARVPLELQADMNRHHVTEAIGKDRIYRRLHDARAEFAKETGLAPSR